MKYIIQKIDKEKELEERITNFTKLGQGNGEQREGKEIEPKRLIQELDKVQILKPGDRIVHKKKKVTGRNIYSDPSMWDEK